MDLGASVLKAVWTITRMLFKPCMKIGHALGLEWMLILYWIPFSLVNKSSTLWYYIAITFTVAQVVLNIFCKVKGERSRNLVVYALIFVFKHLKGEKAKGFLAKLNTDSASDMSGMVFGKKGSTYVTKKEQEDGHALVIGGAGSGKSSGVAIPTLMSWKNRAFVIDIKGELYKETKRNVAF